MADVNQKMLKVLKGFSNLSYEERTEILKQIHDYQSNIEKRATIVKNFEAKAGVDIGPTSQGGCPCCGR